MARRSLSTNQCPRRAPGYLVRLAASVGRGACPAVHLPHGRFLRAPEMWSGSTPTSPCPRSPLLGHYSPGEKATGPSAPRGRDAPRIPAPAHAGGQIALALQRFVNLVVQRSVPPRFFSSPAFAIDPREHQSRGNRGRPRRLRAGPSRRGMGLGPPTRARAERVHRPGGGHRRVTRWSCRGAPRTARAGLRGMAGVAAGAPLALGASDQ